jgi:hypothetical protein
LRIEFGLKVELVKVHAMLDATFRELGKHHLGEFFGKDEVAKVNAGVDILVNSVDRLLTRALITSSTRTRRSS